MAKKDRRLFGRTDEKQKDESPEALKVRQRNEAMSRLVQNQDFSVWFYAMLDTMYGFVADTRELTAFGQGIRAAVGKMEEVCLTVPEGVKFLSELHKKHFTELHNGIVAANKYNGNIGTDR